MVLSILEGGVIQGGGEAFGQEGLVHLVDVGGDIGGDGLVVDRPLDGLAHLRLGQHGVLLVYGDVGQRRLALVHPGEVRVVGDRAQLFGLQLAGWREAKSTRDYKDNIAAMASWSTIEEGMIYLWCMERVRLLRTSYIQCRR